jgi:hypothetical protein
MPSLTGNIPSDFIVDPHFVELSVPENGFGERLNGMVQFCLEHGEELRIGCFRTGRRDRVLFLFPKMRGPSRAALAGRSFWQTRMMIQFLCEHRTALDLQL